MHTPIWGDDVLRLPTHVERRLEVMRPYPPDSVDEDVPETFVADATLLDWIRETFIDGSGPLANEDHEHLADAVIGVLWTNAINVTKQREVLATAEIPNAMAGGWKRARFEFQLREWFGSVPDFLLTFQGPACSRLDDRAFCALVEHELYHCAQALDRYGNPRFSEATGLPVFAIKGHDVEEFVGVVQRYGPTTHELRRMVAAAQRRPAVADEPIAIACGTCAARVA